MMKRGKIIIEPTCIAVTLSSDGTMWMTTEEIASIFHITATNVERHIEKIFNGHELDERDVRTEQNMMRSGKRHIVEYYNLDAIIALCFRINTPPSKAFRRWIKKQIISNLIDKQLVNICLYNRQLLT